MKLLVVAFLCVFGAVSAVKVEQYIFEGEDATDVLPYHVHIEIARPSEPDVIRIGSGTLVAPSVVLTGATNVAIFAAWRCGVGALTIQELFWQVSATASVHPDYNPDTLENNLAMIILPTTYPVQANAVPIPIVPAGFNFPTVGMAGIINGFGFQTSEDGAHLPSGLQTGGQNVLSQSDCADYFPHLTTLDTLDQHFCAVNSDTFTKNCGGDQGNGFIIELFGSFIVGVSSSNRVGDCSAEYPTLYTRLDQYSEWIQEYVD